MVERIQVEALLRSEFGLQRLSRAEGNELSGVTLAPRENARSLKGQHVRWSDGAFWFEVTAFAGFVTWLDASGIYGRRKLASGDRFRAGTTTVEFECSMKKWPVDIERERALLARDGVAAWSVYMDELLLRGDPLGTLLARTNEIDIAFQLEVSPLIASNSVSFVADERGLWREITFRQGDGYLEQGVFDAVLTHPRAWFVRRVTVELVPTHDLRSLLLDGARSAAAQVDLSAGPHLEVVSLPNFPEDEALPDLGEGVTVDRAR